MGPKAVLAQLRKMPAGNLSLGIATHRVARRVATVNAYEFSSSVRQRFRRKHPDLGPQSIALVEAATRQWFRLLARRPNVQLSMPSRSVDDMWHELVLHTREYADFCNAAFGRFLHHEPESAMTPTQAAANRSEHLLVTLRLARDDENCAPETLPLLFRVDHEVGLEGARRYLVHCGGGRGQCYEQSGPSLVCLTHLTGLVGPVPGRHHPLGRSRSPHRSGGTAAAGWFPVDSGGDFGGGCGGGCGGCG